MMKLTIEKFQQLNNVALSDLEEVDKAIEFVRIFTGKSAEQIEKMKVTKFNKICKQVIEVFEKSMQKINDDQPSSWLWVGTKLFYINYNISEITASKYVETSVYSHDLINNLHKVMASMVYEAKWTWKGVKVLPYDSSKHEKISNLMLKADFKHCYYLAVFFYQIFRNLIVSMKPYMEEAAKDKAALEKALTDFTVIMDGLPMPKWCQNLKLSV